MQGIETFGKDFIKFQQGRLIVAPEEIVRQRKGMLIRKNVQVLQNIFIFDLGPAEGNGLVKNRESIAHGSVRLHGNDMERLVIDRDSFPGCYHPQILHHVRDAYPVEVIGLAAGKDGGKNLVLFGGGKDENGMGGRFFQGLEKGVEGLR